MKTPLVLGFLGWMLIGSFSFALSADAPSKLEDYRTTPNPVRLFLDQWTPYSPPPSEYTLGFIRTADHETAKVMLREAILIGLENNPGIVVDRLELPKAAAAVVQEQSIFDPSLNLEFNQNFANNPSGRRQTQSFSVTTINRNRNVKLSLTKRLLTGAQLEISMFGNRFVSNSVSQVLKPEFQTKLGFTFTQPLLRDFGLSVTTIRIRVAEGQNEISALDYQTKLAQLIQQITEAYWAVIFAEKNLEVQKNGVQLADTLLEAAKVRLEVGLVAPVAVTEAAAEKARREELVVTAENQLDVARETLRLILNLNPEDKFLPRKIEPIQSPSVEPPIIDRPRIMEHALRKRFEIQAANLDVNNRHLESRLAENQLLPRLDFKAGANLIGISGREASGKGQNEFKGGFADGVDRLFSGEFSDNSFGIVLQIPLGNAVAKSNYSRARIEQDQAVAHRRELVRQITLEVSTEIGNVTSNFKRIQTTRLSRELAQENLRIQEARHQAGLISQTDLIDFQTRLVEAEGAELRAVTDYNNSLSKLRLVEGTLLDHYNVKIEGPGQEPQPWWAKF
jgi:outer membrane protein